MALRIYKRGVEFPHEGFVQLSIEEHFRKNGFSLAPEGRIDLQCSHPETGERWHIETKGATSAVGLDFRTGIGQLVQAMADQNAKHGLAMPDTPQFRAQIAKFSPWVVSRLGIHWLFVLADGSVEITSPERAGSTSPRALSPFDENGSAKAAGTVSHVVDPNRPWVGSAFQAGRSVLVLGESYVGTYEEESEYDDVYWQQCLDGHRTDPLFDALQTKLGVSGKIWWPTIAYTNLSLGSIGANTQTVVTPAQLRGGLPRLGVLLDRLRPGGVLVLGAATRDIAGPYLNRRGLPWSWVYHPSGKNNWMHGGRYACTPEMLQAAWGKLK